MNEVGLWELLMVLWFRFLDIVLSGDLRMRLSRSEGLYGW